MKLSSTEGENSIKGGYVLTQTATQSATCLIGNIYSCGSVFSFYGSLF